MLPELAEIYALLPQVEQVLTAVNALAITVEAIQVNTPAGKKAKSDIDNTLARLQAHASDLHAQLTTNPQPAGISNHVASNL